jgi:hypothetical protein
MDCNIYVYQDLGRLHVRSSAGAGPSAIAIKIGHFVLPRSMFFAAGFLSDIFGGDVSGGGVPGGDASGVNP